MRDQLEFLAGLMTGDGLCPRALLSADAAGAYRIGRYVTATPRRLAELLHDAAMRLCEQALAALDGGELEWAADRLGLALRIFERLSDSLAALPGRDARRLRDLCEQVRCRLIEAGCYRRREAVAEAISLLAEHHGGWSAGVAAAMGAGGHRADAAPRGDWIG